jgi:predicted PurR-regulated permease PerM
MKVNQRSSIDTLWKVLLAISLLVFGIIAAKSILIPLVFSFFFAIILHPVVSFLQQKKLNLVLATLLSMLAATMVLGSGLFYVITQAKILFSDLPDLVDQFNSLFTKFETFVTNTLEISAIEQLALIKENANELISSGSGVFGDALLATSNLITLFTLIPIYVFFILIYKENFKGFLSQLDKSASRSTLKVAIEIKDMVHSYIVGLLLVIAIVAILNSVGLLVLSLKYAIFISAILTIIPYIGIFIGGLLPLMVALVTKDSLIYPLLVLVVIGTVQFLEGNLITPKIVGSKVNVNPLAAIVALVIGAEIWGIAGMILAIPLTGITKIIMSQYESLRPYTYLLQSDEDNSKLDDRSVFEKLSSLFKKNETKT